MRNVPRARRVWGGGFADGRAVRGKKAESGLRAGTGLAPLYAVRTSPASMGAHQRLPLTVPRPRAPRRAIVGQMGPRGWGRRSHCLVGEVRKRVWWVGVYSASQHGVATRTNRPS